jgi:tetratricopeptide (TPR) repeat protein
VTLITPDGEHVVNVPPSIAAQMAKTDSTETGSNLPQASSYGSSPGFSDSMQQGLILRRQKLFDNAIAKFREATQAAPDCDWCHSMLAETLLQKGDRAAAIAEYKEVVRITPKNPDAHYILAAQFEAEGATQESTGYHFDPKTHTNRPRSAAMSKAIRTDYESAMQEYGMAHQLAPDIPKYQQAYERQARKLKHP